MNSTAVTEQVNMIKNRSSLLLWYTGDEPDGTSDPLNATKTAYDLIYDLDGYHPVSLVLNCYVRPPHPPSSPPRNRLTNTLPIIRTTNSPLIHPAQTS